MTRAGHIQKAGKNELVYPPAYYRAGILSCGQKLGPYQHSEPIDQRPPGAHRRGAKMLPLPIMAPRPRTPGKSSDDWSAAPVSLQKIVGRYAKAGIEPNNFRCDYAPVRLRHGGPIRVWWRSTYLNTPRLYTQVKLNTESYSGIPKSGSNVLRGMANNLPSRAVR